MPDWAGRNYTLTSVAAVITGLGSSGAMIASAFAVLAAGGDGTDVGLVAAARTIPLVVFILIGGAVADRMPRHRVMVAANILNALSQAAFAALVLTGAAQLWHMVALAAVGGAAHAFFSPASEGVVLSSVDAEHASRAFALYRMGVNGANIGGAALGGALISAFGPGWVLVIDAVGFAVAAGLRCFMRAERAARPVGGSGGVLRGLREGWQEFSSRRWLWGIVAQFSVVNAVIVAAEAVYGPLVAEEHLGGAAPWGLALAAFGAGTVLGGIALMRWKPHRFLLTGTVCVFPLALPSAALALHAPAWVLAAVMFCTGVSLEVFGVCWMLALRQEIPEEKMSRVSSYDWFGSIALAPLGAALAGPVADTVGMSAALWGCAGLVVLLTAAVLTLPEVRGLTRTDRTTVTASGVDTNASTTTVAVAETDTANIPRGETAGGPLR